MDKTSTPRIFNPTSCRALLEFSFNLTMGNMDEAYRAVKLIKVYFVCIVLYLTVSSPHPSFALSRESG